MRTPGRWLLALFAMVLRRRARPAPETDPAVAVPPTLKDESDDPPERIIPAGEPDRTAENWVLVLLGLATLAAIGFIVVYGAFGAFELPNELLGLSLGLCFLSIGGALTVVARRLVVTEELEEDYPSEHPQEQQEVAQMIRESGSRFTRKRLLVAAGGITAGVLGLADLAPVLSLGPIWDTAPLDYTPWYQGRRLVDTTGAPMIASAIVEKSFYTAFPEGANPELLGSPLVVVRLNPTKLELPAGREDWAPFGILAYSKICTHADCAVGLYRNPLFSPVEPNPALVCPCHYSTFDPFTGGTVIYGPAGRPLPQLPLEVDAEGYLRAAGNFSARVGPSWWNVREQPT